MSKPIRVQLRRTKGWRMPPHTVSVARPTKWGNPYRVIDDIPGTWVVVAGAVVLDHYASIKAARAAAVTRLRRCIEQDYIPALNHDTIRAELAGKNLACWCPLVDERGERVPCHADLLLEIANREASEPQEELIRALQQCKQATELLTATLPSLKREELIHYAITGSTWWGNARSTPLDVDPDTLLLIKAEAAGKPLPAKENPPSERHNVRGEEGMAAPP